MITPQLVIIPEKPTCSAIQELIRELDNYLATLYPPESRHGLDISALLHKSVTVFLARLDNEPVGCGAVKFFPQGYAEVKRMYIKPAFRGQGIGKKILNQIELYVKEANIYTVRIETGIYQHEAIRLYEKVGFYRITPFGEYKPDPLSLFLEKKLA
ncbi:GNAT family N-acetyltransferase [Nostocaceae cyanobacterium CENA357]|uniref:GNAT family N-acetyltransferase n=1 Tax=Atlanticothrix silvestris CENA357 TaxID=1725252 RepID=A0A8J7L873_9CYAN|nr:GNAT family N-acetyltransferase [Atlanticothrix silvestris]MBH8555847.1 GNAT family N-acetyltransferase [Atlanticothrix silvestris CENA357]